MTKSELKSIIIECIEENDINIVSFTEEEELIFKTAIANDCILEAFENDEYIEEGANLDSRAAFKKYTKEYKKAIRESKKCLKKKDFDGARKCVKEATDAMTNAKKAIKETQSDTSSAVFGLIAGQLLSTAEMLPLVLAYAAGISIDIRNVNSNTPLNILSTILGFGGFYGMKAKSIISFIKEIKLFIEGIADPTQETDDNINYYKIKLIKYCDNFILITKGMEKVIDHAEKKAA